MFSGVSNKRLVGKTNNITKRRTLQVLQPSANDERVLTGPGRHTQLPSKKLPKSVKEDQALKKVKPRRLKQPDLNRIDVASQTDDCTNDIEALEHMLTVPDSHYVELAEKRRLALEEALSENFELHAEIYDLKERLREVKETATKALEEQAEHFQQTLEALQHSDCSAEDDPISGSEEETNDVNGDEQTRPTDTTATEGFAQHTDDSNLFTVNQPGGGGTDYVALLANFLGLVAFIFLIKFIWNISNDLSYSLSPHDENVD